MAKLNQKTRSAKILALCAMLSAISVIFLYMGVFIEVIDLSMAVLASLTVIILVVERGGAYPWLTYAVTSVLSVLLLPNKSPAVAYACFMGFYPILKEKIEKIPFGIVRLAVKVATFNISLLLMWFVARLLIADLSLGMHIVFIILLLNAVFLFYDYALSVMITAYIRVWRKKLRVDRFFK